MSQTSKLAPYRESLAGTMLAAREAVMAPIRPILREHGVTEQQWRVLRVLMDEGASDPSRLAVAAILHPPSVTRILRELAERRLIERGADKGDRRRSIIAISASGAALVQQTAVTTLAVLARYTNDFGPDRLTALLDELRAFTSTLAAVQVDAVGPGVGPESAQAVEAGPSISSDP